MMMMITANMMSTLSNFASCKSHKTWIEKQLQKT